MAVVYCSGMTRKKQFPARADLCSPMHFQFIQRIQISHKKAPIIQTKRNTVLAVPRRCNDFSVNPQPSEKVPALIQGNHSDSEVIDRMKSLPRLSLKNSVRSMNEFLLHIHNGDLRSEVCDFLRDSTVVRMKMRDQNA